MVSITHPPSLSSPFSFPKAQKNSALLEPVNPCVCSLPSELPWEEWIYRLECAKNTGGQCHLILGMQKWG